MVTRRLARLPSAVVETLTAAAALGADAELPVLARATGHDAGRTGQLVEAAVEAGLVEPLGEPERVEFVHAVVREVLLDEAGSARRAALHERAARALEIHRPDAEPALATHWAQAPGPGARRRHGDRPGRSLEGGRGGPDT